MSVFPKHNQADGPMWHLEKLNITDIVKEIENNHFILIQKAKKHIIQTHGRWQDSLKKTVGDNIF